MINNFRVVAYYQLFANPVDKRSQKFIGCYLGSLAKGRYLVGNFFQEARVGLGYCQERRKQLGHWETDNIEGKKSDQSVISATPERTTRYIILSKMSSRKAEDKTNALIERKEQLLLTMEKKILIMKKYQKL